MAGRLPGNPVAPTSRWMAAARARESARDDRLFHEPIAADLAGPEGFAWLDRMETAAGSAGPGLYAAIRTRFFDDFLLDACGRFGLRQVVLAAAGMDTRAFRLDWPPATRLFELDLPEVLDAKNRVIGTPGTEERCGRRAVATNLERGDWPEALLAAGYSAREPSVWLVEGLLLYLSGTDVHELLGKISALTVPGSSLGLDVMSRTLLFSSGSWPQLIALARRAGALRGQRPRSTPGPPRLEGGCHAAGRGRGKLRPLAQPGGPQAAARLPEELPRQGHAPVTRGRLGPAF